MISMFYQRYKLFFWNILVLAFLSGAVSKFLHGYMWEVYLNGGLGVLALIVLIIEWKKEKKGR
ncbi:hypothetical protein [Fredinandcohnia sp. 179-A 10B2 NHS]|uniref:hypothetical protein n=1 Tax=Fredinandcohnia sp. 179-A 10B2 NHS TaxID=3235176 RepID=UPI0039A28FC2